MTNQEIQNIFDTVHSTLDTLHKRKCFVHDYFIQYTQTIPTREHIGFVQWFFDNGMVGSLVAALNAGYDCDIHITLND